MNVLITIGVLALAGLWCAASYNRLVRLRNRVLGDWRQVDVQLKRRHGLVPNLVAAVRDAMAFERGTLEAVIEARGRAARARGPAEAGRREDELSAAIGRFGALVEAYPQIIATGNVRALQADLAATEDAIARAGAAYNDTATRYNTATEVLPANLVAMTAGFKRAELFELSSPAEAAVPAAGLSRQP